MAWYDTAFDWVSKNAGTIANVGGGIYDIYNQQQTKNALQQQIQPGGIVDPFGAQRGQYQQRLSNLYADPSSLAQQPGYQFAQQQGQKGIDRAAAKSGHFHSPNRLYEIAKFNQGLASQTYNQEANRLSQLAGSGINPNAGAYLAGQQGVGELGATSGASARNTFMGGPTGGGLLDLFSSFSGDSAPGTGGGADSGGVLDTVTDFFGGGTDMSQFDGTQFSAAASMGSDALEGAQALEGLQGTADLGGEAFADYYGSGDLNQLSTMGSMASAAGGALGGYGLTKLLGTEGTNAAPATTVMGGYAGAAAGGALAGAAGMTAGGAMGGAAAGAAAMGPMAIPAALVAMAYGGYAQDQAQSHSRKEMAGYLDQGLTLQADGGSNWDLPGQGQYYIDKAAQDMWYSGDIDRSINLFDQQDHNKLVGSFNFDEGRVLSRDDMMQGKWASGLNATQMGQMRDAQNTIWDDISVKTNKLPFERSGYGIRGGKGGSGIDENYWTDASTGQMADQGLLDAFNQSQQRARTSGGEGGGEGVMTFGGQTWQLGSGAGSGGHATFAQYNQHQAEQAARNRQQELAP